MGECRKATAGVNMAISTFRPLPASETVASYASDWEHLMDELRRLDLLIRLRLLREQYKKPPGPLDQFRGLVLSDEEIVRLLADPGRPHSDDTCGLQNLWQRYPYGGFAGLRIGAFLVDQGQQQPKAGKSTSKHQLATFVALRQHTELMLWQRGSPFAIQGPDASPLTYVVCFIEKH